MHFRPEIDSFTADLGRILWFCLILPWNRVSVADLTWNWCGFHAKNSAHLSQVPPMVHFASLSFIVGSLWDKILGTSKAGTKNLGKISQNIRPDQNPTRRWDEYQESVARTYEHLRSVSIFVLLPYKTVSLAPSNIRSNLLTLGYSDHCTRKSISIKNSLRNS